MKMYIKILVCLLLLLGLLFFMGFIGPWMVNQKSTVTLFAMPVVFFAYTGLILWALKKMFNPTKKEEEEK